MLLILPASFGANIFPATLFHQHHLAEGAEFTRAQFVEIDAIGHLSTRFIAALPRHLVSATRLRCIHQLPHLLAHEVIYPQRARTCFLQLVAESVSSGIGEILRQRPSALARTGSKPTNHDLKSARAARASSPDDLPAARRIADLPQLRGCIFWCALGRKEKELPRD